VVFGCHTHVANQLEHGGHVLQAWHVVQLDRLVAEQSRAQLGQRGVFGTGHIHGAQQLLSATDQEFVHLIAL
jgi:hypothetical protein